MTKVKRNHRCPCGSGKKYKNCCLNRKPRGHTLRLNFPARETPIGVALNGTEFELLFRDGTASKAINAYLESFYERPSKRKVLNRLQLNPSLTNIRASLNDQLAQHQNLIAVDTNTVDLTDGSLSVTAVVLILYKERSTTEIVAEARKSCFIEIRGLSPNVAERYGLFRILRILEQDPKFEGKTGVIIDHNLGELESLNSRKTPIFGDYYLPQNTELIYATADSGIENLPNRLIRDCDQLASQFVAHLRGSPELTAGDHLVLDDKGNGVCVWKFPDGDFDKELPVLRF